MSEPPLFVYLVDRYGLQRGFHGSRNGGGPYPCKMVSKGLWTTQIEKIAEVVKDWIAGKQYEQTYPRINQRNVFSVSTLSYSVEKQVGWKLNGKREGGEMNPFMFHGKAVHEYFQRRLGNLEGWDFEHEVEDSIAYPWKNHPYKDIRLLGHIDAISLGDKQLFEFKSTVFPLQKWAKAKIKPWEVIQAGTYGDILSRKYGTFIQPIIIKVNHDVIVRPLTPWECSEAYLEITHRARQAAEKVDI